MFRTTVTLLFALMLSVNAWGQLGPVKKYVADDSKVSIETQNGKLIITPYSDSIIKVLPVLKGVKSEPKPSASVILKPDAKFSVVESNADVCIKLTSLTVRVDKNTAKVSFINDGKELLHDRSSMIRLGNEKYYTFDQVGKQAIYGGGERGQSTDLNGDTLIVFNKQNYGYGKGDRTSQMNITMPYFMSTAGYGVFFDDYSSSKLILEKVIQYGTSIKEPVAYYFILGDKDNLGGVIKNFTALVGRQELPPFWTLGYITSKYGYKTQQETEQVVKTLKDNGYPLDGIVLDLYWYGKETDMGRFQWNPEQWPNPDQMIKKLKSMGVNLVTISQPYLNKIGAIDNYNTAKAAGMLLTDKKGKVHDVNTWVGEAGMLDVSNPKTREWMWNQYRKSLDQGVGGLWGDLGEPEVHPLTGFHSTGESAAEYHNRYGNDWSAIIYNGMKREYPTRRPMLLMRGGTAGLQRYSVFPWSTDVSRSWGGLQAQIPIMLNSSMSGLGYMSSDVGGFAVDPKNPTDAELYARWLQMGLFIPTLRTHSTVDAEPYHYKEYQDLFKSIIKQRYEWLPYNYTLAYENTTTGAPFVRAMNYYDPQNFELSDIEDQYLWGENVIIAPVIEKGAVKRNVVLPEGKWYDFNNTANVYEGNATISYDAPVSVLPVFVKAGSFIPSTDYEMHSTQDYDVDCYRITYYPGEGKSSYTMFEDDRVNPNSLSTGEYVLFNFEAECKGKKIEIDIDMEGKGYKHMPSARLFTIVIPNIDEPKKIKVDNNELVEAVSYETWYPGAYYYDEQKRNLYFKTFFNQELEIKIED